MHTLVIIGGHGGSDSGCIAVDGSYEKTYALELSKKVYNICKKHTATKLLRTSDTDMSLSERCRRADSYAPCYYFSFHFNAYNKQAKGTEIFTSMYTLQKNKDFATYLCKEFAKKFGVVNRGGKTRLGKNGDFYYLHRNTGSRTTTFIIESLFIDNASDFKVLKSPEFMDKAAYFYAKHILSNLYDINISNDEKILYKVQTGAFSDKSNAEYQVKLLRKKGFEAIIKKEKQ